MKIDNWLGRTYWWFAWRPVRLESGTLVWLKWVLVRQSNFFRSGIGGETSTWVRYYRAE